MVQSQVTFWMFLLHKLIHFGSVGQNNNTRHTNITKYQTQLQFQGSLACEFYN